MFINIYQLHTAYLVFILSYILIISRGKSPLSSLAKLDNQILESKLSFMQIYTYPRPTFSCGYAH